MKCMHAIAIFTTFLTVLLFSCREPSVDQGIPETDTIVSKPQPVETVVLQKQDFVQQILSNGTLRASKKAELRFQASGIIRSISVQNGDRISRGSAIALLDNETQKIALDRAEEKIEYARLELNSLLISVGGRKDDSASVNPQLYQNLKIQSGLTDAMNNLKKAKLDLSQTVLAAPFGGIIAGLEAQAFNFITPSDVFCILLDNSSYTASFPITEQEVGQVFAGQEVSVTPFHDPDVLIPGKITEIDPMVDENGLMQVKAILAGMSGAGRLFDGMNVKVTVEKRIAGFTVVPKEAIVLRSNREVAFTYANGLAKWNYVKIVAENSAVYAVSEGLKTGDTVIVKGNLNLAHDAKVILVEY
ncbi:MAG: efflux RND transporter periplasmic adaptor subunit [Bacteroidales bacterium]|nr:efflux RND transporter periplasmic adaptor subunit [Bacteroidales bacterium]